MISMATTTTVNFRTYFARLRRSRRHNKAAGYLREHIARFNAVTPESVKIDRKVNDYIMSNVISQSSSLKLSVNKTAAGVEVKLAEEWKGNQKAAPATVAKASKPAAGVITEKKEAKPAEAQVPKEARKPEQKKEKSAKPAQPAKPADKAGDQVQK